MGAVWKGEEKESDKMLMNLGEGYMAAYSNIFSTFCRFDIFSK